ncbi:siderophore-iron reductase FhuF [Foliimonas ilicis]|uniref:siderophore-iron reductase FhuF n=1 Tax=Mesorhizobium sp. SB112 TaxID=3151853 RepID=UPI00326407BD
MIPVLASILTGDLSDFGESFVGQDDTRAFISGQKLLEEDTLRACLERFSKNYNTPEPIAVATLWSKWHISKLLPASMAAIIIADTALPLSIDKIGVVLSEDGHTVAFRVDPDGHNAAHGDVRQRFGNILDHHLAPLFSSLAKVSGIPTKVLWSNAGNVAENVVRACEELLGADHAGVTAALSLFSSRKWPDGSKNFLFEPVRYVDGEKRQRKLCCLRYRMDSLSLCKTCPLEIETKA